uniref:Putative oligopeptide transporter n=1 Tax=Phakopsora pachyrhizi TaxID=170000 RepID=A0A0S1MIS6_PHAPC
MAPNRAMLKQMTCFLPFSSPSGPECSPWMAIAVAVGVGKTSFCLRI